MKSQYYGMTGMCIYMYTVRVQGIVICISVCKTTATFSMFVISNYWYYVCNAYCVNYLRLCKLH